MITADVVKKLRDMTGAGMMDCKKALTEANGDMDKAVDVLRKSGAAKAEKKSGRATKEGKVACKVEGNVAAMVEVLCETDFVAKTDKFNAYIDELLNRIIAGEGKMPVYIAREAAEKALEQVNSVIADAKVEANAELDEIYDEYGIDLDGDTKDDVMLDIDDEDEDDYDEDEDDIDEDYED